VVGKGMLIAKFSESKRVFNFLIFFCYGVKGFFFFAFEHCREKFIVEEVGFVFLVF
jgi:hypothetical protein